MECSKQVLVSNKEGSWFSAFHIRVSYSAASVKKEDNGHVDFLPNLVTAMCVCMSVCVCVYGKAKF
jgi:hypothetical protein